MADPVAALAPVLGSLGLRASDAVRTPSWNGRVLEEVHPWGTIRHASREANLDTAHELVGT